MRFYLGMTGVVAACALVSIGFYFWYMHDIAGEAPAAVSVAQPAPQQQPATVVQTISTSTLTQSQPQPQKPAFSQADLSTYKTSAIVIDEQPVAVLVADTPALQALGLGNRTGLPADTGMLFVFQSDSEEAFWMKDMHFSIDMIWISASGRIVYMAQNVSPDTYPENFVPTSPARYVLEVPANYAAQHGWKTGDSVAFKASS